jgi:hypothetical protein
MTLFLIMDLLGNIPLFLSALTDAIAQRCDDKKEVTMIRMTMIAITLMFVPAATLAQVSPKDDCDFGKPGAMSMEELRQEPITFELDIPYADYKNTLK